MTNPAEHPLLVFGLSPEDQSEIAALAQRLGGVAVQSPRSIPRPELKEPMTWGGEIEGTPDWPLLTEADVATFAAEKQFGEKVPQAMWRQLSVHGVVGRPHDSKKSFLSTERLHLFTEQMMRTWYKQRPDPSLTGTVMRLALRLNDNTLPESYEPPAVRRLCEISMPDIDKLQPLVTSFDLLRYGRRLEVSGGEQALGGLFRATPDIDNAWPGEKPPEPEETIRKQGYSLYRPERRLADISLPRDTDYEADHTIMRIEGLVFGKGEHSPKYELVGRTPEQFLKFAKVLLDQPKELRNFQRNAEKSPASDAAEYTIRRYARALRIFLSSQEKTPSPR